MRDAEQRVIQGTTTPTPAVRRPARRLTTLAAGVAALLAAPVFAGVADAGPASAGVNAAGVPTTSPAPSAPSSGVATSDPFYTPPSPLPAAKPGTLIRSRPLVIGNVPSPTYRGWSVMYHSRDTHGRPIAVTGAVFTPTTPWTGHGARPYVGFGVGTQGLGPQCAPSKQFAAGSEYETPNVLAALSKGWGVAVTDYEGYVNGATPTYVTGASEAHAVLDSVRVARALPGSGATTASPVGLWGYSQGGGATGWAAALAPHYAPDVRVVGSASGGVPADLRAVGQSLNGSAAGGLLGYSVVGFATAYPKLADFDEITNDEGKRVAAELKTECVGDTTTKHAFLDVQDLTKDRLTFEQLSSLPGQAEILRRNDLGRTAPAPTVPVLQYHSSNDEIVPLPQALALHRDWCADGVPTAFAVYPGEHLTGNAAGAPAALAFLDSRFRDKPFASSCRLTG